jgi:hypothetical protein
MSRCAAVLLAILGLSMPAWGVTVRFALSDFTAQPAANRRVLVAPLGPTTNESAVVSADLARYTTDTNGVFWMSNVVAGYYEAQVQAPPTRSTLLFQFPGGTNTVEAKDYLVPPADAPLNLAYTKAEVDALIAAAGAGGALTNNETRDVSFQGALSVSSNVTVASLVSIDTLGVGRFKGLQGIGEGEPVQAPDGIVKNEYWEPLDLPSGFNVGYGAIIANDAGNFTTYGTVTAAALVGNGNGLTNLTASNSIVAGTITTNLMDAAAYALFASSGSAESLVYNVTDFGANGADGNDDTVAIQAALDAAAAGYDTYTGRRIVYLPAGRYYITNTLWLKNHGITVRGDGMYATLIRMQANTNAFGSWTNRALWYCNFEKFNVYKDVVLQSVATPAAFYFVASDSTQIAHRFGFDEVACSGFYYGIYVRHAVGLYAQRCEFYGCNYAFYMEKSDATTFVNCHAGDAYDSQSAIASATNRFGATHSAAWTYKNTPTASRGFSLVVIGGESRRVDNVFDLQSGAVNIVGTHCELIYDSLLKASGSGVSGGIVSGLSCVNLVESRTPHAAMRFLDGTGKRFSLGPCYWPYSRPLAQVEQAGDYVHYTGQPALMSNTVSSISWYMPVATNKVVVAAGNNVTVTPSQSGPVTTYTVAATGGSAAPTPARVYTTNYTVDLSQSGYLELVSTGEAFGLSLSNAGERSVTVLTTTNPINYVSWPRAWWSAGEPSGLGYNYALRMRIQRVNSDDVAHITASEVECAPLVDEDAQAFLDRAGITDATISNAVQDLVVALKATNLWSKADAIFPFVGGTSNSTRMNLRRDDKHIVWGNQVTFDADGVWGKKGFAPGVGRGEFAWDFTSTTNQFQTN